MVQASPSLNPGYPCGVVHSGIWRFSGSEDFVAGLRSSTSYGGRLQFRCDAPCVDFLLDISRSQETGINWGLKTATALLIKTLFYSVSCSCAQPHVRGGNERERACLHTDILGAQLFSGRLAYSAAIGDIRSTRGAVVIRTQSGQEISWNLIFDVARAAPGQWTHISVVLREDHGWLHEPLGTAVSTTEMKDLLNTASDLLIRGDLRVYGRSGGGQEVVYLQDVRLLGKA